MNEFWIQLRFSLRFLLKQQIMVICMLFFLTLLPLSTLYLEKTISFELDWLSMLQLQMLFMVILAPVLVQSIWNGRLRSFERSTIVFYLRQPTLYFLAKIAAVWLLMTGCMLLFDSGYWLLAAHKASESLWLATMLQIVLTTSFTVSLAGIGSLILKRTMHTILLFFIYLIASIQFIRQPMLALWFNPDFIGEMILQPSFILLRCLLLLWSILALWWSASLFRKQVISR